MKKKLLLVPAVILIVYLLGPSPATPIYDPSLPDLPDLPVALETYIAVRESKHYLKPGNEAEIVWADPVSKRKTPVAIVYLHGFTASKREGFPTHVRFAERYGCNLYLARLKDHGIDTTNALLNFTADRIWRSAVHAYAVGKRIGHEVIIMSTSTGGTLALKLAAEYPEVKALINFSPNIEINDPAAFLLNNPWGLHIARLVFRSRFRTLESDEMYRRYWYATYRLESITELQELVETAATSTVFRKVTCPVFNGYYYRNKEHQDPVVRVSAIERMHRELATPDHLKVARAFPTAGDHVIACDIKSGALVEIYDEICRFAEAVVGLVPVSENAL